MFVWDLLILNILVLGVLILGILDILDNLVWNIAVLIPTARLKLLGGYNVSRCWFTAVVGHHVYTCIISESCTIWTWTFYNFFKNCQLTFFFVVGMTHFSTFNFQISVLFQISVAYLQKVQFQRHFVKRKECVAAHFLRPAQALRQHSAIIFAVWCRIINNLRKTCPYFMFDLYCAGKLMLLLHVGGSELQRILLLYFVYSL